MQNEAKPDECKVRCNQHNQATETMAKVPLPIPMPVSDASVHDLWDILNNGFGGRCLHSCKEIQMRSFDLVLYVFINVNDNQSVRVLSIVSINENVFQSLNRMLSGSWANKSVDIGQATYGNMGSSILAKVKDLSVISELHKLCSDGFDDVGLDIWGSWIERCVWIDPVGLPTCICGSDVYKKLGGRWGNSVFTEYVCILGAISESNGGQFRGSILWKGTDASGFLREEDVVGGSDLVDSFEEGEIRDDSVLYNDGCIKDCMEQEYWKMMLGDSWSSILQGDGDIYMNDNEVVTQRYCSEKTPSLRLHLHPRVIRFKYGD
ncbi:hypothetical protein Tco_0980660 [Tanacetum coccineum]